MLRPAPSPSDKDRILKIGVLVFCCLMTAVSVLVAYLTWRATPNISRFSLFAEPQTHRVESKGAYLLGPIVIQFLGLFSLIASFKLLEHKRKDLLLTALWAVGTCISELIVASRSLQAFGASLSDILPF